MIIKIRKDLEKCESLCKMALITLERLEKTNIVEYPSNSLVDYYDVIHKLLESLTLKEGIKIKGKGAHRELIDYVSSKLNLGDEKRLFLQQMREYRNRISYEGFMVSKNYILINKGKIAKMIDVLYNKLK